MLETMEQVQQEAYARGQQMKQWHLQQRRVVTDEACAILGADFAQMYLFKSNQSTTVGAAHERAGLCVRAFQEGYHAQRASIPFTGDDIFYDERKETMMEPMEELETPGELETEDLTILQIMPALPGWGAVWGTKEEPEQGKAGYFTEPVVCWALVETRDGRRFVTAMAADLETSELKLMLDMGNFLGYATPTSSLDWMQRASNKRAEN